MMLMMNTGGRVNGAIERRNEMSNSEPEVPYPSYKERLHHRINYEILRERYPGIEEAINWYFEQVEAGKITTIHEIPREILDPIAFYLLFNNGTCVYCGTYNWYRFGEIVHPSLCDYRERYDHNLEKSPRQKMPKNKGEAR